jgi:hypothetical protein
MKSVPQNESPCQFGTAGQLFGSEQDGTKVQENSGLWGNCRRYPMKELDIGGGLCLGFEYRMTGSELPLNLTIDLFMD